MRAPLGGRDPYARPMGSVAAAAVWHHWISYALLAPAVLMVLAIVVGYWVKVSSRKYPRG